MGSPDAEGHTSRGRYFYISKGATVFFPALSTTVNNDFALVPVIPPFSDKKVYSTFVYHNDKFNVTDGSRDEFRLYLNKDIDPNGAYYLPDDIIVIERYVEEVPEEGGFSMPVYVINRFPPASAQYDLLEAIIDESPIKGGHALVDDLPFLTELVSKERLEDTEVVISDDAKAEIIKQQDEVLSSDEDDIEAIRGAQLFNSSNFRDFVLLGYGYKCAITKEVISWNDLNNLEAAHIKPRAHIGTFLPCNGIALSRDMHWAFDKGFITISDDLKVIVHDEVMHTFLNKFDGMDIIKPLDPYFQPAEKFLHYHRENIYGLFKHSGMIRRII